MGPLWDPLFLGVMPPAVSFPPPRPRELARKRLTNPGGGWSQATEERPRLLGEGREVVSTQARTPVSVQFPTGLPHPTVPNHLPPKPGHPLGPALIWVLTSLGLGWGMLGVEHRVACTGKWVTQIKAEQGPRCALGQELASQLVPQGSRC